MNFRQREPTGGYTLTTRMAWTKYNDAPCYPLPISSPWQKKKLIVLKCIFSYKYTLIQGGELNRSAILENLVTHKLLLSRTTSPKDLEDLCLNIFGNYAAIELEIARRDPDFAVVSNV